MFLGNGIAIYVNAYSIDIIFPVIRVGLLCLIVPVTIRVQKVCHFGQKTEFVTATKKHIYIKIKYLVDKSSKFC